MRKLPPDFKLETVTQKPEAPNTSSETKKMTGFSDIGTVAAAAPSGDVATPKAIRTPGVSTKARQTEEQKKADEKAKLVEEALSKVGVEMMKELAELPYEAWAVFWSDPLLKLTPEESAKLSNTYFLILKAIKPEQVTDWRILLLLVGLQNTRICLSKVREHSKRVDTEKKRSLMNGGENVPQVSIV